MTDVNPCNIDIILTKDQSKLFQATVSVGGLLNHRPHVKWQANKCDKKYTVAISVTEPYVIIYCHLDNYLPIHIHSNIKRGHII